MKPLEIGVMFWADKSPREKLRDIKSFGVSCGQLGLAGDTDISPAAAQSSLTLATPSRTSTSAGSRLS